MALINCPECGKEISDKANSCPNCGYKKEREVKIDKKRIITFAIPIFILCVILCVVFNIKNSLPNKLLITLDMSKEEVHKEIGNNFILEQDKYERDVEVYNLKWCGYDGKLSITYSSSEETVDNWKWEIDTSEMNGKEIEDATVKIRDKISNIHGTPEESGVSRLEYKWVTTHTTKYKGKVTVDVGYKLIREDILWLHYGEVY